ncbi:hypothetical protein [Rhizobium leguminosarum]|uniref:hypothetical protein n=1 Tax=Rhizobium leguminosarum TaxID=384 RepID=UPI0015FBF8BA|nr:hypothetical protein [Rhizobium leguminosarum]MBA8835167.1 hypothetical protein [Rhizobium leguminosarum]
MEAAISYVQFDDIEGEVHVLASFDAGFDITGFGPLTLNEVLTRLPEDHHFEIKSIFEDMLMNSRPGYGISFEVDDDCHETGVRDLMAVVGSHEFHLGSYFVFAEGNGVEGLRSWVRIRERRAAEAQEVA